MVSTDTLLASAGEAFFSAVVLDVRSVRIRYQHLPLIDYRLQDNALSHSHKVGSSHLEFLPNLSGKRVVFTPFDRWLSGRIYGRIWSHFSRKLESFLDMRSGKIA